MDIEKANFKFSPHNKMPTTEISLEGNHQQNRVVSMPGAMAPRKTPGTEYNRYLVNSDIYHTNK